MSGSLFAALLPAILSLPASGSNFIVGEFNVPAIDTAAVKAQYGIEAFANPASSRGLSVGEDGALTLTTTLANEVDKGHSVGAGIRVPLNRLWVPRDIRQATAVTFRIKGSSEFHATFALGSDTYPNVDDGVMMVAPLKVSTAWTQQTIALQPNPALAWLLWMEDKERFPDGTTPSILMDPRDPNYDNSGVNVAKAVTWLQFDMIPTWETETTWIAPAPGVTTLSIDDLVIVGLDQYSPIHGVGCVDSKPSAVFSDMLSPVNVNGTPWYAYTDSDESGQDKGASSIVLPEGWTKWRVDTASASLRLIANLSRITASNRGGFAGIGSSLPDFAMLDVHEVGSIRFALGIPPGVLLDSSHVAGVHFKVSQSPTRDSTAREVFIPRAQINGDPICVDVDMLRQPGRQASSSGSTGVFPLVSVSSFFWEIMLDDPSGTVTSIPNQGFMVGPVAFYGVAKIPWPIPPPGAVGGRSVRPSFSASYAGSVLSVPGLEGYQGVDLLSLSGVHIASLKPSASVRIRLDRGAYLLVARGKGKPALSRTLMVAK